ncbi:response regulator [Streptomyces sp. Ru72]|uniref:response regulator n=1 Tax=Streptomyces sp. Ru72 TaxID=2080747 RepID=UPI000CDDBA1B|nr:response regulator [Streptomyces sp. Ru72]POX48920.1 hypothetical protein C3488_18820 [Streptomyces sp. Ru72]
MRILVVEDEPKMRDLLRRALTEEGYAVDTAEDGPQALALTDVAAYGAMVLDVMLPGLDGFEVCAALRWRGTWLPVLMLTAKDAVADRVQRGVGEDGLRQENGGGLAGCRIRVVPNARGQGVGEPGVDVGLDVPSRAAGEFGPGGFVALAGLGLLQRASSRNACSSSPRAATRRLPGEFDRCWVPATRSRPAASAR